MTRTRSLAGALALAVALAGAAPAFAQQLKVMVAANPGGGWDTTARAVLNALQAEGIHTGGAQVTNKGGAGGTIGLAEFINSERGNDNAFVVVGSVMVGGILTNKAPVTLDQLTPIARLTIENNGIAVPVNSPFKTVKDFTGALKKDPGAVAVGGGSAGGIDHITLALIAKEAGIPAGKVNYVAYQGGGEMIAALAGGKLAAAISGVSEFKQYVDSGRLRLLAVTSEQKLPGVNAPTLRESGVNVVIGNWRGIAGPPGMSPGGREKMIAQMDKLHASRSWKETREKQGWDDAYLAGDRFAAFLKEENVRVTQVLKDVGLLK